jgi:hypothetical protein
MKTLFTTILSFLLLSGCATKVATSFVPYAVEVQDRQVYNADLDKCHTYALDYLTKKNSLDVSEVASAGARSALGNVASIAVSPAAVGLSGLGGSSSEALSEFGLNSEQAKKIIAWCMHDKGAASGKYVIYDPNL